MISSRTKSREEKVRLLKEMLSEVIELLLMEHRLRERVKLVEFKRSANKLKEIHSICKTGKWDVKKCSNKLKKEQG
jgi:iron-sulfur cluster repair protein YtfE (RIC family)